MDSHSHPGGLTPVTRAKYEEQMKQEEIQSKSISINTTNNKFNDWEVGIRYHINRLIGKGSYGQVSEAIDNFNNKKVAIKRMLNIFSEPTDAKRAYREIHILRQLKHNNIIDLKDVLLSTLTSPNIHDNSKWEFLYHQQSKQNIHVTYPISRHHHLGDLYLVFEFMDTDLSHILRSPQYMKKEHIQFILYQMLLGMKYVHSANVIHRYVIILYYY